MTNSTFGKNAKAILRANAKLLKRAITVIFRVIFKVEGQISSFGLNKVMFSARLRKFPQAALLFKPKWSGYLLKTSTRLLICLTFNPLVKKCYSLHFDQKLLHYEFIHNDFGVLSHNT
ncbi:MAG: hypothetical protein OHM56_06370 [Spiroplasma phoeniceum]|nr:MAG: hypothetical protein OHM56_06370 [Spiroplasma phoeniceum]